MRGLDAPPVGADAEIAASELVGRGRALAREEVILDVESLRWEDGDLAHEQCAHLFAGPANGRGRGNNFRAHPLAIHFPGREVVNGVLIQSDQRTEWAGDEVQLVLYDEIWWT